MNKCLSFFLLLVTSFGAWAGQPSVEVKIVAADRDYKVTEYSISEESCSIAFSTHLNTKFAGEKIKYIGRTYEMCSPEVGYDERLKLYDKILARIFNSNFYSDKESAELDWGPIYATPTLVCRLIGYGAKSEEWRDLLRKFGNKSVSSEEVTPYSVEIGKLVRNAGLLREIERMLPKFGYYLKDVRVGGFFSEAVNELNKNQRKCLAGKPMASIVPTGAVIYLLLEKNN